MKRNLILEYQRAKRIIQQHNVKRKCDYFELCKKISILPTSPENFFNDKCLDKHTKKKSIFLL